MILNLEINLYFQLIPTEGMIRRNNHLKFGRYHQHLHELLDLVRKKNLLESRLL